MGIYPSPSKNNNIHAQHIGPSEDTSFRGM